VIGDHNGHAKEQNGHYTREAENYADSVSKEKPVGFQNSATGLDLGF
jgi:hypothetical protein